jgi:hypothetical protein
MAAAGSSVGVDHHVPHSSDRLNLVSFVSGAELSRAILDPLNFFTVHLVRHFL